MKAMIDRSGATAFPATAPDELTCPTGRVHFNGMSATALGF